MLVSKYSNYFFIAHKITLCTKCAQGFISNGSTGCVEDCTDGVKIGGICTKTDSECTGNWREATQAEMCTMITSGSFPYSAIKISGNKKLTTCAGAGFQADTSSTCKYYTNYVEVCETESAPCDTYVGEELGIKYSNFACESRVVYYNKQGEMKYKDCYSETPQCTTIKRGAETCCECSFVFEQVTGYCYYCYYSYSKEPEVRYSYAIAYNCTATYSYVWNATSDKVCIKN